MAFPEINTGYRPEFGLGALYQGFNAGNADQMAQEELIKQFLANQRSQQMNPIDVSQAQQNLDSTAYKTRPEYQDAMTNTQVGQSRSSLAAGDLAQGLLPFKQKAEQGALVNSANTQDKLNQLNQLNDMISTEANPLQRMAQVKARQDLLSMLKETPEFAQKRELKETGTDSAEYIAELRAEAARRAAEARGQKEQLSTAEQALMKEIARKEAAGDYTHDQAQEERAKVFNAKMAAKIQPGNTVNPAIAPEVLKPKPQQQQYMPPSATPSLPSGWTLKQ